MCESCPRCEVCGERVLQPAPARYWLGLLLPLVAMIAGVHWAFGAGWIDAELYWFAEGMFIFSIPVAIWTDPHLKPTLRGGRSE